MVKGWSTVTHRLLKASFIGGVGEPIRQNVHFWTLNGINGSMAYPGRAPILRTKKQMNKCMAEI